MELGSIVKSTCGRDSGRWFVVVSLEDNFAGIADGRLRKLEKPKRKKLMHLKASNRVVDLKDVTTNKLLWKQVAALNGQRSSQIDGQQSSQIDGKQSSQIDGERNSRMEEGGIFNG